MRFNNTFAAFTGIIATAIAGEARTKFSETLSWQKPCPAPKATAGRPGTKPRPHELSTGGPGHEAKSGSSQVKGLCSRSETKFQGLQTRIYGKNYGHWQYQQHHGNQHPDFSFTGLFH